MKSEEFGKCQEFGELLGDDLDVPPARRAEVAAHLHECAKCRALAAAAKRLREDLDLEIDVGRRVGAAGPMAPIRARPRLARVAAAAALFVLGIAIGGLLTWRLVPIRATATPPANPQEDVGPRFLLALYERGPVAPRPPSDLDRKVVGEYVAWAQMLKQGDHLDFADRLRDDARAQLRVRNGMVVVDQEFPDPGEPRLGGFFLIKASSMDEAILLARSSPHLRYGGEIEIREIDRSH